MRLRLCNLFYCFDGVFCFGGFVVVCMDGGLGSDCRCHFRLCGLSRMGEC